MSRGSRIPISPTVLDSWRLMIGHAPGMLRVTWLPALMVVILEAGSYWPVPERIESVFILLIALLAAGPYTVLFVPWYRSVLSNKQPTGAAGLWRMQTNHLRFLWRWILLGVLPLGILLPLELIEFSGSPLFETFSLVLIVSVVIGLIYIVFRISMILPAAALGHVDRIDRSWKLTRGNGGRIFVIQLLAGLPLIILWIALTIWEYGETSLGIIFLFGLVTLAVQLVVTNAHSLCYRALGGMDGGGMETTPKDTG